VTSPAPAPPARARHRAESLPAAALLVALTALAPLAVDMFLPSMPTMAEEFAANSATLQLAVTLFLLAFATSQLVYGSASDRFGRRPVLFAGLALFAAGGFVAGSAGSAEALIAGRVIQGLGGGAGPAVGRAIVMDVYGRERAARVLASITTATALAPTLAPIAGGVLHDVFGWRSVFVTLVALGVVLAAAYAVLIPETNRDPDPRALTAAGLVANYRGLLSSRVFVGYALVVALMFGGQLVFISSSAFVLIEERGLGSSAFGLSFGFVAIGIMLGAALSGRLVMRWPLERVVLAGAVTGALASATMAALAWTGVGGVWSVIVPMFVTAGGFGVARPPATAGALIPFPRMAGLASALLGFLQMLLASLYSIAFSAAFGASGVAMASGIAAAAACGLVAAITVWRVTPPIEGAAPGGGPPAAGVPLRAGAGEGAP